MHLFFWISYVAAQTRIALAKIDPDISVTNVTNGITGEVELRQNSSTSRIQITLTVKGLSPNSVHGWHIHASAAQNRNCTTAGSHSLT
jgi:Cu/Zn superoxide dismutase